MDSSINTLILINIVMFVIIFMGKRKRTRLVQAHKIIKKKGDNKLMEELAKKFIEKKTAF